MDALVIFVSVVMLGMVIVLLAGGFLMNRLADDAQKIAILLLIVGSALLVFGGTGGALYENHDLVVQLRKEELTGVVVRVNEQKFCVVAELQDDVYCADRERVFNLDSDWPWRQVAEPLPGQRVLMTSVEYRGEKGMVLSDP
ncbi:MAG: hypothetical protein A2667_01740 [Candidatus Wildermuthbacteria bacterium RIFCSPHIGHO2_01_FULL_47_27]|uniref:Uncharacterized protein n=2 Tax=Candidatus Wildermuthiibacteriota TaxID=1817923 RepID=A0A1G2RRK2_9BACT|nr:MAG: hypothetical protein UY15_C0011G0015 [Parcubacteria group bacterium GW2011_GWA2_47_9]OHA63776.1 MAG: hypothetical protein A2667_01740 [Candidatus Wildermuthbacteria bacterium RIFCSPHIGHO2_01_FULL_47_27]OHA68912.1 MAG: hypothetical protein A3D59_00430 [Candidatus Wildermuthbacteria bacterium RIFCSPHIGHO2_02_FULL_47_17]OHA75508.1 MAG: hypothetical protein A3I38_02645 [Candidatus Wildermuthbacteria bacterium RIFCSPLOWO2_02_FULL_47_10]OHA75515.1 MAG: hypothetical protein A3A32_00490 [Candid